MPLRFSHIAWPIFRFSTIFCCSLCPALQAEELPLLPIFHFHFPGLFSCLFPQLPLWQPRPLHLLEFHNKLTWRCRVQEKRRRDAILVGQSQTMAFVQVFGLAGFPFFLTPFFAAAAAPEVLFSFLRRM